MKITDCEILEKEPLSKYSYMKTGGVGERIIFPLSMKGFLSALDQKDVVVLGNCSNVLFPDEGLKATVIITTKMKNITIFEKENCTYITAEAGASMASVAKTALDHCLTGFEFAHGIPGTVGGGVYMNAGAYGGEIKDVFHSCICRDKDGHILTLTGEEMEFSYRSSILQRSELILLSVTFKLTSGNKEEIKEKMEKLSEQRKAKQPLDFPSCGSFFKRPEGYFAAKLIEDASLKGFSVGGAQISPKHAGYVINTGNATTADILELSRITEKTVFEKFGVKLEREVRVLSYGEGHVIFK